MIDVKNGWPMTCHRLTSYRSVLTGANKGRVNSLCSHWSRLSGSCSFCCGYIL